MEGSNPPRLEFLHKILLRLVWLTKTFFSFHLNLKRKGCLVFHSWHKVGLSANIRFVKLVSLFYDMEIPG